MSDIFQRQLNLLMIFQDGLDLVRWTKMVELETERDDSLRCAGDASQCKIFASMEGCQETPGSYFFAQSYVLCRL
jgi:hypothetical protein